MPSQAENRPVTKTQPELIALRYSLTMSEDKETAEILVYGYIVSSTAFYRWIRLDTDDMSASDFDKALKKAKAEGAKNLHLRINSGGGVVPQAQAMRTMLMGAGFDKIVITVDGICASAATLLTCIPNAHVRVSEGSEFMIHRPRYGAWGTLDDLKSAVQRMEAIHETVCGIYANHTQQEESTILDWMRKETWFTAQKAVDAGFAHEVYKGEQATASVAPEIMQVMKTLYEHIPEDVAEEAPAADIPTSQAEEPQEPVSPDTAANPADVSPENKNNSEEDTELMANENTPGAGSGTQEMTLEQLRAQNPALYDSLMKSGGEAERARMAEIDALTPPGYEDMAAAAKEKGTAAMDYHKEVVAAQKEKAAAFVTQRKAETAAGAAVPGAAADTASSEPAAAQIDKDAKDIAAYAAQMNGDIDGGMY